MTVQKEIESGIGRIPFPRNNHVVWNQPFPLLSSEGDVDILSVGILSVGILSASCTVGILVNR